MVDARIFLPPIRLLMPRNLVFAFEFFAGAQNTRYNDGHAHHSAGSIWCGLSHWIVELSNSTGPYSGFWSYCCRQLCCHKAVRSVSSFGQIVRRTRSALPRPGILSECNTGSISCFNDVFFFLWISRIAIRWSLEGQPTRKICWSNDLIIYFSRVRAWSEN